MRQCASRCDEGVLLCVRNWDFASFGTYWLASYFYPPVLTFPLSEWREPSDYVRPEERGTVLEAVSGDVESESGGSRREEKGVEGIDVNPLKDF